MGALASDLVGGCAQFDADVGVFNLSISANTNPFRRMHVMSMLRREAEKSCVQDKASYANTCMGQVKCHKQPYSNRNFYHVPSGVPGLGSAMCAAISSDMCCNREVYDEDGKRCALWRWLRAHWYGRAIIETLEKSHCLTFMWCQCPWRPSLCRIFTQVKHWVTWVSRRTPQWENCSTIVSISSVSSSMPRVSHFYFFCFGSKGRAEKNLDQPVDAGSCGGFRLEQLEANQLQQEADLLLEQQLREALEFVRKLPKCRPSKCAYTFTDQELALQRVFSGRQCSFRNGPLSEKHSFIFRVVIVQTCDHIKPLHHI